RKTQCQVESVSARPLKQTPTSSSVQERSLGPRFLTLPPDDIVHAPVHHRVKSLPCRQPKVKVNAGATQKKGPYNHESRSGALEGTIPVLSAGLVNYCGDRRLRVVFRQRRSRATRPRPPLYFSPRNTR